jgi:hypothetical protein
MAFIRGEKLLKEYRRMEQDAAADLLNFEDFVDLASEEGGRPMPMRKFHTGCAAHLHEAMLAKCKEDSKKFECPHKLTDCPVRRSLELGVRNSSAGLAQK